MDILQREGNYPMPPGASAILGVEFSGHVARVGEGVTEWREGDEVLGLAAGVSIRLVAAISDGRTRALFPLRRDTVPATTWTDTLTP